MWKWSFYFRVAFGALRDWENGVFGIDFLFIYIFNSIVSFCIQFNKSCTCECACILSIRTNHFSKVFLVPFFLAWKLFQKRTKIETLCISIYIHFLEQYLTTVTILNEDSLALPHIIVTSLVKVAAQFVKVCKCIHITHANDFTPNVKFEPFYALSLIKFSVFLSKPFSHLLKTQNTLNTSKSYVFFSVKLNYSYRCTLMIHILLFNDWTIICRNSKFINRKISCFFRFVAKKNKQIY